MTDATDKVVGLIPVVIATDLALRVVDRTFPRRQSSKKRKRSTGLYSPLRL